MRDELAATHDDSRFRGIGEVPVSAGDGQVATLRRAETCLPSLAAPWFPKGCSNTERRAAKATKKRPGDHDRIEADHGVEPAGKLRADAKKKEANNASEGETAERGVGSVGPPLETRGNLAPLFISVLHGSTSLRNGDGSNNPKRAVWPRLRILPFPERCSPIALPSQVGEGLLVGRPRMAGLQDQPIDAGDP